MANYVGKADERASDTHILLEPRMCEQNSKTEMDEDIKDMATKLSGALPAYNIPRLLGHHPTLIPNAVTLVFERPKHTKDLRSFASIYESKITLPSLRIRMKLCSELATAVLQAHKLDLVHKNIRPDDLLIARTTNDRGELEDASVYLAGWQHALHQRDCHCAHRGYSSI